MLPIQCNKSLAAHYGVFSLCIPCSRSVQLCRRVNDGPRPLRFRGTKGCQADVYGIPTVTPTPLIISLSPSGDTLVIADMKQICQDIHVFPTSCSPLNRLVKDVFYIKYIILSSLQYIAICTILIIALTTCILNYTFSIGDLEHVPSSV